MQIGILGGSFDPPHKGHRLVAERLLTDFGIDRVILMPCYEHPFNKNLSPAFMRLNMLKNLENKSIQVSSFELKNKRISYTIDTLLALQKQFKNDTLYWIIGSDQIINFRKWKNWQDILEKFKLIVVPRTKLREAKKEIKDLLKEIKNKENLITVRRKDFSPIYVSSTLIRKKVKNRESIKNLTSPSIESYIIKNSLYL